MKTEHTTVARIVVLTLLLAGRTRAEWSVSGNTATDGNWNLTVANATLGDATGLTITKCLEGAGDLDLTSFYDDTGQRIIKVEANVLRYPGSASYKAGILKSFTGPDILWLGQVQCADVTNVCVPQCTYIGASCFYGDSSLERVQINAGLTNIGQRAFMNASALRIVAPSEWPLLETVGDGLFSGAGSLEGVFTLGRVTALKGGTFNGCAKITGVTAPLCTVVTQNDFQKCSNLVYAVFSPEIATIGSTAFFDCVSLRTFAPATLPHLATVGTGAFRRCWALETAFVFSCPTLTTLPGNAFADCFALREVHFRSPIAAIGGYVFSYVAPRAEFHFYSATTPTSLAMTSSTPDANGDGRLRVILHNGVDFDAWTANYTPVADLKPAQTARADFPGKHTLGLTKNNQWVVDGRTIAPTILLMQ